VEENHPRKREGESDAVATFLLSKYPGEQSNDGQPNRPSDPERIAYFRWPAVKKWGQAHSSGKWFWKMTVKQYAKRKRNYHVSLERKHQQINPSDFWGGKHFHVASLFCHPVSGKCSLDNRLRCATARQASFTNEHKFNQ
jgi:hypothetical protein